MNLMLNGIEAIRDANGQVNVRSQLTEDNQVLGWIIDTGMGPPAGMIDNIVST
jgi:phosphoglycerate-specific signal transduction histidine kinase